MAALPTQIETQYAHPTVNPARSPNASRVYAYGPPAPGTNSPSRANTSASVRPPAAVTIQPGTLSAPNGAKAAGSRKIPDPIVFPMTRAVVIQNPMRAARGRSGSGPFTVLLEPHAARRAIRR